MREIELEVLDEDSVSVERQTTEALPLLVSGGHGEPIDESRLIGATVKLVGGTVLTVTSTAFTTAFFTTAGFTSAG